MKQASAQPALHLFPMNKTLEFFLFYNFRHLNLYMQRSNVAMPKDVLMFRECN